MSFAPPVASIGAGLPATTATTATLGGAAAGKTSPGGGRLAASARQFGAMFMTEMVRLARPEDKAVGAFKSGTGERSWQIFMDQALGQAAAGQDASALVAQIRKVLERAEGGARAAETEAAAAPSLQSGAEVTR